MIGAVFFDVGGTLIRPWPSVGAVYARVGEEFGICASAEAMEQAFRSAWKELKNGAVTTSDKEWWRALVRRAAPGAPVGYFEALYDAFAQPAAWRVYADVTETLDALRRRGLHVGVISNWDERLRVLLERMELSRYFDSMTISCEVGAEKPAAAIFRAALAAAGALPAEALHVGDSDEEDRRGAEAVGMKAILVRQNPGHGLAAVISAVVCA
jgi:putative hydrolase of the HAD superfamily